MKENLPRFCVEKYKTILTVWLLITCQDAPMLKHMVKDFADF